MTVKALRTPKSRGEQDAGMLTKSREVRQGYSRPEGASHPAVSPLYWGKNPPNPVVGEPPKG